MREFGVSNYLQVHLEEKRKGKEGVILVGLVLLLVSIIPSVLSTPWFLGAGAVIFLILLSYALSPGAEEKRLEAGIQGENSLKNRLKQMLSDEYIALFNLPLPRGGDIDCFLVGPTGAYLFDVKHHKGYILYCNGEWNQMKVGRRGKAYEVENFRDPSSQVKRGILEVKRWLKEKGVNLWIEGVVVFTNPQVKVFSEDIEGIKVVKIDELETVFNPEPGTANNGRKQRAYLSAEEVNAIATLVYEGFSRGKEVRDGGLSC